jgi:hypothetical protein
MGFLRFFVSAVFVFLGFLCMGFLKNMNIFARNITVHVLHSTLILVVNKYIEFQSPLTKQKNTDATPSSISSECFGRIAALAMLRPFLAPAPPPRRRGVDTPGLRGMISCSWPGSGVP